YDRVVCVVRAEPQSDVHGSRPVPINNLAAEPIHRVVIAFHRNQAGTVNLGCSYLARFEIVGNQNEGGESGSGRVCGDGVCEISGRRAAYRFQLEFQRLVDRNSRDTILEGKSRGVYAVILQVKVIDSEFPAEAIRANQRRATS